MRRTTETEAAGKASMRVHVQPAVASPGVKTRVARISLQRSIGYEQRVIEANTDTVNICNVSLLPRCA